MDSLSREVKQLYSKKPEPRVLHQNYFHHYNSLGSSSDVHHQLLEALKNFGVHLTKPQLKKGFCYWRTLTGNEIQVSSADGIILESSRRNSHDNYVTMIIDQEKHHCLAEELDCAEDINGLLRIIADETKIANSSLLS
jgi:hypothetical protein